MTRPIRHIIFAVKSVHGPAPRALRKAAALARALGAKLELFHAIAEPVAIDALTLLDSHVEKFMADEQARYLKRLETLARRVRRGGLQVSTVAEWDHPAHEAVIRRVRLSGADLILAERHASAHVAPWFLRYTDWELLRQSPVPVLLFKTARPYAAPRVLAAVDPSHAFDKSARLDAEILQLAARVCAVTRGRLHAVHAFVPDLIGMTTKELSVPDAPAQITTRAATLARERMDKTLRATRLGKLPAARRHLVANHPVDAIPALARRLGCDLVVMGAMSRSGLKRLAFGNTAERLLDELPADLLIAKPPGFVSRVRAKSRGAQLVLMEPPAGLL